MTTSPLQYYVATDGSQQLVVSSGGGGGGATPAPVAGVNDGAVTLAGSGGSAGLLTYLKGTVAGQVLQWGGAAWVAGALNATTLASFAASPAVNQFLKGNGPGVAASWGTLTTAPANPGDNNKAAIAVNGDFSYAFIADANIASNAAISTSKIAPAGLNGQALITTAGVPGWGTDFGSQNLVTTGSVSPGTLAVTTTATIGTSLAIGTNPASAGIIGLPNGSVVQFRNAANSANLQVLQVSNTNVITLGLNSGIAGLTVACAAGGTINSIIGGTTALSLSAGGGVQFGFSILSFPTGSNASISIAGNSGSAGSQLAVTGGNTTQASANGGVLVLAGGASQNATPGFGGGVKMQTDTVDTAGTMLEINRPATAQHYIALFGRTSTTAQMGAGTGDYVLYVANAATVPTVDATNGYVSYSDGAKPAWRFNGTNIRLNGTSATASAGGGAAPPATVLTFIDVQVNGTQGKLAVFAA